jgi:hypothetical protein
MLSLSLNKALNIMLLKTVTSLMCIWDCGVIHHLIDDCAGAENDEYQDYQGPCANPDYIDDAI